MTNKNHDPTRYNDPDYCLWKKQEIINIVNNTQGINKGTKKGLEEVARLQDLFGNVTAGEVYRICQELDGEGKRRLLWIITTISGYEVFELWVMVGILEPWAQARLEELEAAYNEREQQMEEELHREEEALKKEKERLIRERGRVQAELGKMRKHVQSIQNRLEKEIAENKRIKKLERLLRERRF